jgi:hypothetical protein
LAKIRERARKRAEREAKFSGEREIMEELVREELNASPAHQVRQWLADGTWIGEGEGPKSEHGKLDPNEIEDEFGAAVLRELPTHRNGVLAGKRSGGLKHWEVARMFGLTTHELIDALTGLGTIDEEVTKRVNEEMAGSIGARQDTPDQQSLDALHGEAAVKGVVRDLGWLKKQAKARAAVRAAADRTVAEEGAGTAAERTAAVQSTLEKLAEAEAALERLSESGSDAQIAEAVQEVEAAQIAAQAANERRQAGRIARRAERAARRETAGLKVEQKAARLQAELDVARIPVGQLRPNRYSGAERRAAELSRRLVAARDYEGALQAKRDQLYNHFAYRAAREAQATVKAVRARTKRIMRIKNLNKIEGGGGLEFRRHVVALAVASGLAKGGQPKDKPSGAAAIAAAAFDAKNRADPDAPFAVDPTEKNLGAFVADLEANDGVAVSFDPEFVAQAMATGHYNFMSLSEIKEVDRAIRNLDHIAVQANKIRLGDIIMDREQVVATMVERIRSIHGSPAELAEGETRPHKPKTWRDRFVKIPSQYVHAWLVKMESFAVYLDGEEGGPVWQFFGQMARDAQFEEHKLKQDWGEDVQAIFSVYNRAEKRALDYQAEDTAVPEVGRSFTRAQMLAVALNCGNAYNREALKDGYGWTDDQVRAILAHLEERDLQVVERVWSMIEKRWGMIKEHEIKMSGIQPSQVESDQFTLSDGRVLAGGYYPLKADLDVNERAYKLDEKKKANEIMGGQYASQQTNNSHTKERRSWGDKEVLLDLSVLYQHMNDVAHDVAQRKFVVDAIKIIDHKDFSTAIKDVAGTEMLRTMREWVHNIAGDSIDPMNPISRVMKQSRIGANVAIIGFSLTTIAQQPFGVINGAAKTGFGNTRRAISSFIMHPLRHYEFIIERSKEIPTRARTRDREVAALTSQLKPDALLTEAQAWGYFLVGWIDVVAASVAWSSAYSQGMNELFDNNEQKAIDYADRVVVQTQGAGAPKDLPRIQSDSKGGEMLKQATVFHTFFNAQYNFIVDQINASEKFNNISRAEMLNGFAWTLIISPVMINLMLGRHPDLDEPAEEWVKWGAWSVGGNLVSSVPLGSQVGRLAEHPGRGFSMSPSDDVIANSIRALTEISDIREEGLIGSGFVPHSIEAIAMWYGVPGYIQGKRLTSALAEHLNGEHVPLRRPLFGARK